ncbi:MAG: SIR2 family protein [Hyphomicrobiales bacterium]|nr:SIR2 family protein [Hyphomicrobiales bacterium]
MRFLQNGPSIPDDLLIARDEGRVVFFCGAGVSRACAGLYDFFGLADEVIKRLRVSVESPVCKILSEAREIEKRTGVSGLISADRIFGLLERDFVACDIESAVAKALKPPVGVDLSAHRILLDLATTREGKVRLVTTNFDRLFEDCKPELKIWQPPRLPDPSHPNELDGIIHLHGCATKDYSGSDDHGFVLSSSEFGRAYLSDGWATGFFREIVDRYVVVFVGYAAEDPPVQYLLEALNKKGGQLDGVYAFQAGTQSQASARWYHKGVEAIAYLENDGHRALWETLNAWAQRANAPEEWYKSIVDLARKGPEQLQPHERGQVAHTVSTIEGARHFSEGDCPPPADWLCVFDPYRRYAKPGRIGELGEPGIFVDPFDFYGLDSDEVPSQIDPEDYRTKRDIPKTAWDGLAANRLDRLNSRDERSSALRGYWANNSPTLPSRLGQIGEWIAIVAYQPASVWWAAHQIALHPDIQRRICSQLERSQIEPLPVIRQAWHYLFEVWEKKSRDSDLDWYDLKAVLDKDGWDNAAIRRYASIKRPYLTVKPPYWGRPKPPELREGFRIRELVDLDVEYSDHPNDVKFPDKWLAVAIRELRKNLEHALHLEIELGGYGLNDLSAIIPETEANGDWEPREHGLSASVRKFASLFERLIHLDLPVAHQEFAAWPIDDDTIFSRLRMWACGNIQLVPASTFGSLMASLSDDAFWDEYHQRDLLLVLAKRWPELSQNTRKEIEDRLIKGPCRRRDEEDKQYDERRARQSLNRITWLADRNCEFSDNLDVEIETLRAKATDWKPKFATKAAEELTGRGGWVRTDTQHASLSDEPPVSTLSKALELSGRSDDFLIERDPYAGLSAKRPVHAFAALTNAASRNEYPEWAWRTFLSAEARQSDKPKFSALIAARLTQYPVAAIAEFTGPASNWLLKISKILATHCPTIFDDFISKLINLLRLQPNRGNSVVVRGSKRPDWTSEAINAPVGKIGQALFLDPRKDGLRPGGGFPAGWFVHVNDLLSLPGDLRCHALAIFSQNLNWFYTIDPKWTESNLLSVLDGGDHHDRNAAISGFLWHARVPNRELYVRIKPCLLTLAKEQSLSRHRRGEALARFILAGWGARDEETNERYVSDEEMHDVLLHADEGFRSSILWLAQRWSQDKKKDIANKWADMLLPFLRDTWPLQKSVKTPVISDRLVGLAFSNEQRFPQIVEIILPLLTTINLSHVTLVDHHQSRDTMVDRYPRQTLALLHSILPDNVGNWPYDIEAILQRIGDADSSLRNDERLIELKRKWNSR